MIEIGSVVSVVVGDVALAVVTGFDEDGWPLLETLDDEIYLGSYPAEELEELE